MVGALIGGGGGGACLPPLFAAVLRGLPCPGTGGPEGLPRGPFGGRAGALFWSAIKVGGGGNGSDNLRLAEFDI